MSNTSINTAGYNTQAGLGSPVGGAVIDALAGSFDHRLRPPTPSPEPDAVSDLPTGTPADAPADRCSRRRIPSPAPAMGPAPDPSADPDAGAHPAARPSAAIGAQAGVEAQAARRAVEADAQASPPDEPTSFEQTGHRLPGRRPTPVLPASSRRRSRPPIRRPGPAELSDRCPILCGPSRAPAARMIEAAAQTSQSAASVLVTPAIIRR